MRQGRTLASLPIERIPGILLSGLYSAKEQGHQPAAASPIINTKQNPRTADIGIRLQTTMNRYGIFGTKGEFILIKSKAWIDKS